MSFYSGGGGDGFTWHLSVVNAGQPRGDQARAVDADADQRADPSEELGGEPADRKSSGSWPARDGPGQPRPVALRHAGRHARCRRLQRRRHHRRRRVQRRPVVHRPQRQRRVGQGRPVGQARLSRRSSRSSGDWDGDGKADIGIFGQAWARRSAAIASEPGLPDPYNKNAGVRKNVPPPQRARPRTAGGRMQRTSTGRTAQRPDRPRLPLRHARRSAPGRRLERRRHRHDRRLPRRPVGSGRRRQRQVERTATRSSRWASTATFRWSAISTATASTRWACIATAPGISTSTATACWTSSDMVVQLGGPKRCARRRRLGRRRPRRDGRVSQRPLDLGQNHHDPADRPAEIAPGERHGASLPVIRRRAPAWFHAGVPPSLKIGAFSRRQVTGRLAPCRSPRSRFIMPSSRGLFETAGSRPGYDSMEAARSLGG